MSPAGTRVRYEPRGHVSADRPEALNVMDSTPLCVRAIEQAALAPVDMPLAERREPARTGS
ncbi:hypothetical protein [Streptomyces pseudovenezuelae]|uniref:Uncharacterized protein n=1 Tax=Streptomyces pseudovenezuelae TaxID=67350 RepID=A0ABT6M386_9ACTN|nr:hypothetical protein [Streptomyces pseudovenezuelae]MDH6222574.1 hypothetical protein [Streptomyces pseudovenezuelae]